jgi:hypothetical protein
MSVSSLFSSPSKQAAQAASAEQGVSQQSIDQAEAYVSGQQQQERGAIQGLGDNPYFSAAQTLSPTPVNPSNTVQFGSSGPGTTQVGATATPTNTSGEDRRKVT